MTDRLREAFVSAGADVRERSLVAGRAYLHPSGRAIAQVEERAGTLRARVWLSDRERAALESRPTFDRSSGWIHLVSDDDVRFVCGLAAAAYRAATTGRASPPSASTVEIGSRGRPGEEEKKKGALPRRPPSRTTRSSS